MLLQCPHNLGKTKLDSIDKVVDLIRTVSRDMSPESSKDCECYNELYQEKENQTDDEFYKTYEMAQDYAKQIESQQAQIDLLNAELDETVSLDWLKSEMSTWPVHQILCASESRLRRFLIFMDFEQKLSLSSR